MDQPDLESAWTHLPGACGPPPVSALLRSEPDDFRVRELLNFDPGGEGEHLLLRLRKVGWNTGDVARWLADALGVKRRLVTFAGRKDLHAVTEQWFGVHCPGQYPELPELPDGLTLLEATRHHRKLRLGALVGNAFRIRLRDLQGPTALLHRRLHAVARHGVPNYFGDQRFGIDGGNLRGASRLFQGQRMRDRTLRGLYLSAARSFLFNRVLATRVANGTWNRVLPGDLMTFSGSRSVFPADAETPDDKRVAALDLHPTGPMPGIDGLQPFATAHDLEQEVMETWPTLSAGLRDYRVHAERRALRLPVTALGWHRDADDLVLSFRLPPGAFATAVLREIADIRKG